VLSESPSKRCGNREMPSSNLSSLATEGEGNGEEKEADKGASSQGAVVALGDEEMTMWARDRGHGRLGGGRRT
jgi:hypothetical protein